MPTQSDLRKLIKYEEKLCINTNKEDYFQALFKRTTASYRAKVDKENTQSSVKSIRWDDHVDERPKRVLQDPKQHRKQSQLQAQTPHAHNKKQHTRPPVSAASSSGISTNPVTTTDSEKGGRLLTLDDNRSIINKLRLQFADNLRIPTNENRKSGCSTPSLRPASTTTTTNRREDGPSKSTQDRSRSGTRARTTSNERSRTTSKERPPTARSTTSTLISRRFMKQRTRKSRANDPVSLYHYYQNEWAHFRQQIPGESSHANLRWQIRSKLLNPE